MSTIAVFLVVGGASAFAATELAKNSVGAPQLKGNAVTTGKIKKDAVTAGKIKDGAIGESKLGPSAVTNGKLADNAVNAGKIANSAVTAGKLADNAVGSDKIAGNAVTSDKIVNSAVTNGKLAANSVTSGKIGNGQVGTNELTEAERSQVIVGATSAGTQALDTGLFGAYTPAESVASLTLPAGNYVVTAQSEFINVDTNLEYTSIRAAVCRLLDDGAEIAEMSTSVVPGLLVPTGGLSTVGVSDGGQMNLACRQGATNKLSAYKAKIIATRVATVTG
jgi:hypothetical protein